MVRVAIDEGPMHGPRTGVGNAVSWLFDALRATDRGLELTPYVTSMRARPSPPTRKLPIPAAAAHRLWARSSRPTVDRFLDRPDILHGTNYVVPPARCPRIVSVYDCWFLDHPSDADPVVARAGAALRRSVTDGANVVTSSEATSDRVRELLSTDRVTTIHLGAPPLAEPTAEMRPERLHALGDDSFVLALGTVERRKNLPLLVRAFERLAAEHPTVCLVIAGGPGDDAQALARTVAGVDASVQRRIHMLGRVGNDEKRWLLHRAAVLAYPSLDEGFGFPILEAQQVRTPVVASTAGSIPEVAGRGALFSSSSDSDALAANMHWVLTSESKTAELIAAGQRNVDRFSWSATADAYIDLYEKAATTR